MAIETIIHNQLIKQDIGNTPWDNSPYKELLSLTVDSRGKVGERICSESCKTQPNIIIEEDISDVNAKGNNIHYDIKINGVYLEIKTSYRDKNNTWQHETIYKNSENCDAVLFIDFDYNGIHFSIFKTKDLPLGVDSMFFPNKHATLRKNHDDGYKLDFSRRTMINFNNNHYCYFSQDEVSLNNIGNFIAKELFTYVIND